MKKTFTRIAFRSQYYIKKNLFRFRLRLPHFKKAHLNTFPAVHFKKMDWLDFTLKLSSEIFVLGVALLVGGLNVYFFHGTAAVDNSYAARMLENHPVQNPKLAARLTSINTVVVAGSSFFSQAYADDYTGLSTTIADSGATSDDQDLMINDGSLVKPNISTSQLMAKQVKVYETVTGDTIHKIALDNGISDKTIAWANNLPVNASLKPGWQLIILPTDGILVKADSNTTLPDIAKKYNVAIETIISYNGLENAEDVNDGDLIIVPGGTMPAPPAPPKPKTTPKNTSGKINPSGVTEPAHHYNGEGHLFPWGYCTWYVASKIAIPFGGNAKAWPANARAFGMVVNREPTVGSIMVTRESSRYGHVAYVEKVDGDSVTVSEMNYEKFGKVDYRTLSVNNSMIVGFIHP